MECVLLYWSADEHGYVELFEILHHITQSRKAGLVHHKAERAFVIVVTQEDNGAFEVGVWQVGLRHQQLAFGRIEAVFVFEELHRLYHANLIPKNSQMQVHAEYAEELAEDAEGIGTFRKASANSACISSAFSART